MNKTFIQLFGIKLYNKAFSKNADNLCLDGSCNHCFELNEYALDEHGHIWNQEKCVDCGYYVYMHFDKYPKKELTQRLKLLKFSPYYSSFYIKQTLEKWDIHLRVAYFNHI